jgi:hypothetical protein
MRATRRDLHAERAADMGKAFVKGQRRDREMIQIQHQAIPLAERGKRVERF